MVQARSRRLPFACDTATLVWLAAALVLSGLTFFAFTRLSQLEPVSVPWPFDPGFAAIADGSAPDRVEGETVEGWQVEGDRARISAAHGKLRLRNVDPEGGVGIRQLWRLEPGGPRTFRLAATVASDDIQGGRNGFQVGEVSLVAGKDVDRAFFHPLHRVAGLRGTRSEARYVEYFRFPAAADRAELAIRLRHATGELRVSVLRLTALAELPWFTELRVALQLAWAVLLACGVWQFARGIDHRGSAVALGLATLGGMFLLLMPEGMRDSALLGLSEHLPGQLAGIDGLATLGHFTIYLIAGCLVRLSRRGDPWPAQLVLLVGLAGLTEVLQFLSELRSPALDDWAINALGAFLGWLPAAAWLWWRQDGQLATQRRSSTTVPPQSAKQRL
ncbi:MAG: hypothetical protein AB7I59_19750 [Geminicoccaceae bacterium]